MSGAICDVIGELPGLALGQYPRTWLTSHRVVLGIPCASITTGLKVDEGGESGCILSLGELIRLEPHLVEIIPHEGVEITSRMVAELHEYLELTVQDGQGVLVNQRYAYSYTWPAMRTFGASRLILAEALVLNGQTLLQRISDEFYRLAPRDGSWHTEIFSHYDEALQWLRTFF